jgi:hypothetical protein
LCLPILIAGFDNRARLGPTSVSPEIAGRTILFGRNHVTPD